ncbi:hypothetical protein Tsubulata_000341 [Turnera subulata]|uniref:Ubiquitin-conjugating enzyme E2C-binding protein n=1 Tax=Turnera subulata TaxID=218843 RepID=A0A9Q0J090_9ROSI|nr:hypothetical protein Tsubulata_000341 [Turnera subulata]
MCSTNPRKWRFTWEAQSHSPTLKLFLFDSQTNPSLHCHNLLIRLDLAHSHLLASWTEQEEPPPDTGSRFLLRVPIPRVLIDPDSPVTFRALDDHIEAKLVLLLPVDHPILSRFDSVLNLDDDADGGDVFDPLKPLTMEPDVKSLSSTDGVHFYCRKCSSQLTRTLFKQFVEMPSVDWRELADNWFGNCCCSFGGVSEKLVNKYAHAYACTPGVCLLDTTAVTLCGDDLVGCKFSSRDGVQMFGRKREINDDGDGDDSCEAASVGVGTSPQVGSDFDGQSEGTQGFDEKLKPADGNSESLESVASRPHCCDSTCHGEVNPHNMAEPLVVDCKPGRSLDLMPNQRSFLNGLLGGSFMARSYNLSVDIKWKQFFCPQCSCLLGIYPCSNDDVPIDGGVRLFKCYISSSLPVGGSADYFRRYTLEKMFASQLVESAKDELSFRTVVRDLTTRSPMLQVVLVNPNSWCFSGDCLDAQSSLESVTKSDLLPVIKILFSACSSDRESQSRLLEDWVKKNQADEVFMLTHLVEELIEIMESAEHELPSSCRVLHGLSLSSMLR